MARLSALPAIDIIRGFKGVIDFYLWRGLPCARAWPRWRPARQSDASKASATLFGAVVKGYNLLGEGPLVAFRNAAADQPRSARDIYVSATLGHLHERTIPEPPPPPEEQMYDAYVCLRDLKPVTTEGGTFSSGAWRLRDLTEEQADPAAICTLTANQFTLPAASYRCLISCPAFRVVRHQARLWNQSLGAEVLVGSCAYTVSTDSVVSRSVIAGRFTLAAPTTLQIEHRCTNSKATTGFGLGCDWTDEVYTIAEFWRESPPA